MTPAHDPRGPLTVLSTPSEGASTADHPAADGPGLFEIASPGRAQGTRHITTVRRLAGAGRAPGTVLISAAAWLLVAIGAGALYVSFDAQRQYVFAVRQHQAASIIEALLLDLLMIVFTLLALGLSRAGKSSRAERALILACAAASAYMNVSDADTTSPRSVAAYILAPLTLAVVVDRVVAVIRRHVLADEEPSAWAGPGRAAAAAVRLAGLVVLYSLRFVLAPPETATGLRRYILQAAPLPPVQSRTGDPYVRTGLRTGPWPVQGVDRDAVVARLADEIRDAIAAEERWQPDYPALMQATGRRRSWCEKAVRDARTAVFNTPDDFREPVMTVVLTLLALAAVAIAAKATLFSSQRVRRMRWRIMVRLRPGPGFATLAELTIRWSRLAAIHHGRRARPSMRLHHRITVHTTEYAIRLGRAQYGRRVFARAEDQTLILSLPRSGKSGMLGDRVIDHPGAALVTESRPDIYTATAGYRARLGPIEVFNPEHVSGIPSTFTWGMTMGCEDPAEAIRRAADLVGAIANVGEMAWWVEKSAAALAAGMHAAALLGGDMGDVWAWSNGYGTGAVEDARAHPAASLELFGALAELDRPGKTADSIRLTMSKALTWLAIPDIRAMVTGPDARPFDVGRFTDARGTIYMLAPGGDGAPCAPLFRCFASHIHRAARHHGLAQPHRKLDPGLLFALDELHLCPVDLPAWLADSAGKGIQVAAVVHSTGQLRDKYGEHGAATVWSTAGTKIFLPGIHDTATLEDVSKLCGTLGDGGADHARRVMPPELLARLPDWHALVVAGSRSPVVIKFRPSWRRIEARLGRAPKPLPGYGYPLAVPPVPQQVITDLAGRRAAPAAAHGEEGHDESA